MQKKLPIRVVIDTNIWISLLWSYNLSKIDKYIFNKQLKPLYSSELLNELSEVFRRPKFRSRISQQQFEDVLLLFEIYGEQIEVTSNTNVCRDIKDNFLLNLAFDGKADYLISGDKDIFECDTTPPPKIITISEFINLL